MPFLTYCTNKGCRAEQQPLLNIDTNEVLCSVCGGSINSLTNFAKSQLKSLGQTTKNAQSSKQTYSVKCGLCKKDARPVLRDDKLICCGCNKELTSISGPFSTLLKAALKGSK